MAPPDLTTLRPTATLAREHLSDGPMMPTSSSAIVGLVGLGHMCAAFALNLIAEGRHVLAYDRIPCMWRLSEQQAQRAPARLPTSQLATSC